MGKVGWQRDPDGMRKRILDAATAEFARFGLSGARIDRIADAAGANKRMLYYHVGNKEKLYLEVLEAAYERIRAAERELKLEKLAPVAALVQLMEFTWHYYLHHPELMALLNTENLHRARYIKRSRKVKQLHSPFVAMIAMRAAVKGAPVIATGVLLQTSPMSVMGFVEKNIRKPEDIKGKTVVTTPGGSPEQIWPLFLKKTGLKESEFRTVSGDATTKLNAVINGQADLLLGYVMDQSMGIKAATGRNVYPIKYADYGINPVSSGIITSQDLVRNKPDLVRRMMAASTKAILAAVNDPKAAAKSILKALPKGGKIETLTEGFELTIPLYKGPAGASKQPFLVSDQNMADTVSMMVEYGGLAAVGKRNFRAYYTNDYLPKDASF
jgi:NitT/TauT family transport system substrate-binding protein